MKPICEISVTYDKREVQKAISCYLLRVQKVRVLAVCTFPIFAVAVVLALVSDGYALLAGVFVVLGGLFFEVYYHRPLALYRKFYAKRRGGVYRFGKDNISITGAEVQSRVLWSVFKSACEVPNAFFLTDDNKFAYVFPKACLNDGEHIEQFRHMLADKFPSFKEYK